MDDWMAGVRIGVGILARTASARCRDVCVVSCNPWSETTWCLAGREIVCRLRATSGYCTTADLGRLDGFLRRCRRLGYCEQNQPSIAELFSDIDDSFLVVLCLILNIFYNSFYTIVQPPTLSDQEIIAKLLSLIHISEPTRPY